VYAAQCTDFICYIIEVVGGTFAIACIFAYHHEVNRVASETSCCKTVPAACTGHIADRAVHSCVGIIVSNVTNTRGAI
jgi:hypothetical protein